MKGINIKKLAAIATGAALLGSAIAPMVSAIDVAKEDIYNSNGSPKVSIVIGSDAALSDAVWAGNLAAKIAEKAAESKTVSASATGESGELSSSVDLSELTVDVTIGGTVTFGDQAKEFSENFASTAEVNRDIDTNPITSNDLEYLYDSEVTQKITNGDQTNQRPSIDIQEKIGVEIDVQFDTDEDVKDLVAKIKDPADFIYRSSFGTSGIDLGDTSFTDSGANDNVKIVFFGETYELNSATLTGTKYVKLVKVSARESYMEEESIEGLIGQNEFAGQEMSVKVSRIIQYAGAGAYDATFELFDASSNLVDTQTISTSENLSELFEDSDGEVALTSNLYIDTIALATTSGLGYVEVTKGTDTVELYDGQEYPYDSSAGSDVDFGYKARIGVGTGTDVNNLTYIQIENDEELWSDPEKDAEYDQGPLFPTNTVWSVQGNEGTEAVFLNSEGEDVQGYGYAKVSFLGFEGDQERSLVKLGAVDSVSEGGIEFKDASDSTREVPFYIRSSVSKGGTGELDEGDFSFEGETIYFDLNYGTLRTTQEDTNFNINTADYVNNRLWTIASGTTGAADINVTVAGAKPSDFNLFHNASVGDVNTLDGVAYRLTGTPSANKITVAVDSAVEFRRGSNTTGDLFYNVSGTTTDETYGWMLMSDENVLDGGDGTLPITLALSDSVSASNSDSDGVFYASKLTKESDGDYDDLWLLLDAQKLIKEDSAVIQNSHSVWFGGTQVPNLVSAAYTENEGVENDAISYADIGSSVSMGAGVTSYGHYVPKIEDFNKIANAAADAVYSDDDAYFVAEFAVVHGIAATPDFNAYVNTETGKILNTDDSDLTTYSSSVVNLGTPTWSLDLKGETGSLTTAYNYSAAKVWLEDNMAKFSLPQALEQVEINVYGGAATKSVSGGEVVTLSIGDKVITETGTELTMTNPDGATCAVSGEDGDVACTATPAEYASPATVRNPLVYLDSEAPAGTNIIVGGHIVNSLASSLVDRLTAPGQTVAEVDGSGNIYVAGYVADDTVSAVKELIDAIDAMELA